MACKNSQAEEPDNVRYARIYHRVLEFFKGTPGPFRSYVNPQRDDGVFVGQDKPLKPCPGVTGSHGEYIFPAVPGDAKVYPSQVPQVVAKWIITQLNDSAARGS